MNGGIESLSRGTRCLSRVPKTSAFSTQQRRKCFGDVWEKSTQDAVFVLHRHQLIVEEDSHNMRWKLFLLYVYKNREVKQVIFYSNHGSQLLHGAQLNEGVYSDFIWNLAGYLACIEVILPDSSSQCAVVTSSKGWESLPDHEKARAFREIHRVKNDSDWIPMKEVKPKEFRDFEHYRQAVLNREPAAMAVLAGRRKTKTTTTNNLRLNKLHALLQSQEVADFLEKPVSFYTGNALEEVYERIAKHHEWPPMKWADITPVNQG
ncbi:hypothetical protein V8C34DRAFT_317972 [Trichoderma compactum]